MNEFTIIKKRLIATQDLIKVLLREVRVLEAVQEKKLKMLLWQVRILEALEKKRSRELRARALADAKWAESHP